ncbi:GGDEF domain-containing protein, partial [Deinococcus sp.]|uniref:GGDEF domain-containing protein n=1 Tax=Deinococcus sp. TaxID=47478 RepID=UPI002869BDCA
MAPQASRPSPDTQFRRSALLVLLCCVLVTTLVTLAAQFTVMTASDHLGLLVIALKNAALITWLWRRPQALQAVGITELVIEVVSTVGRLAQTLLVDHTVYGLGGYSYWMFTASLVASLVLRPRAFLVVSSGQFLAMLGIVAVYWWSPATAPEVKGTNANLLLQLMLVHATIIAFLFLHHRLRLQYVTALCTAEQQAHLAQRDALTGLANRRQLQTWLDADVAAAGQGGRALSLVLFDLDHFKSVNDMHGHTVDDEVLRACAHTVSGAVWGHDRVGRWGGEEFLILVAGDVNAAQGVAGRLRAGLNAL